MVPAPGLLHIGGSAYFVWAYPPNAKSLPEGTEKFIDARSLDGNRFYPLTGRSIYHSL